MAKEKLGGLTSILSEKSVDKIVACVKDLADKAIEQNEKENAMKEDDYKDIKDRIKNEFNRIMDLLEKEKPGTEKYKDLCESLYKVKNVMTGWY